MRRVPAVALGRSMRLEWGLISVRAPADIRGCMSGIASHRWGATSRSRHDFV
jgi:hypothetical protein